MMERVRVGQQVCGTICQALGAAYGQHNRSGWPVQAYDVWHIPCVKQQSFTQVLQAVSPATINTRALSSAVSQSCMQTDVVIKHLHADHVGIAAVVRLCAHVHALSDG